MSKQRTDERNVWLDAAPYFEFRVGNGVVLAVRPDPFGMWALLRERPGWHPQTWDGQQWRDEEPDGWRGQHARNTALRMVPKRLAAERADDAEWRARRARELAEAELVEEHLAEHAKGVAA